MKIVNYDNVVTDKLLENTLDHNEYIGFLEDYRAISCLMKTINPSTVFEIGTNIGSGVNVIKTALPDCKMFSLDLDYETMSQNSKQYPLEVTGSDRVGSAAKFEYTQLRGDSLTFNYKEYPCEAYFIDGEHDFDHPFKETTEILKLKPKIIIWHDADMVLVEKAILSAMTGNKEYNLFRIKGTRIAYATKK